MIVRKARSVPILALLSGIPSWKFLELSTTRTTFLHGIVRTDSLLFGLLRWEKCQDQSCSAALWIESSGYIQVSVPL